MKWLQCLFSLFQLRNASLHSCFLLYASVLKERDLFVKHCFIKLKLCTGLKMFLVNMWDQLLNWLMQLRNCECVTLNTASITQDVDYWYELMSKKDIYIKNMIGTLWNLLEFLNYAETSASGSLFKINVFFVLQLIPHKSCSHIFICWFYFSKHLQKKWEFV